MKITQFCQLYPPAVYGGGEFLFFNYARELVRLGHEVNVITQMLKGVERFEVIDGVNVHRVGRPFNFQGHSNVGVLSNLSYMLKSFKEGLRIAKGCDLIHSNTYAPALTGHFTAKFRGLPHVITVHDVYSGGGFWDDWSEQSGVSKSLNLIGPLFEKLVLKLKPDLIHTVSEATKDDLLESKVRAPVRVVPCTIDLKDYKKPRVKVKNQFCYVGRHVFYKNVDTVIRAMPAVLGRNPKAKFIVMGDGPMRESWERLAKRLGVSDNVIFPGRVSHDFKLKTIAESKFTVLPSTVEGFGIVTLESWALNKPVIASDVRPMSDLISSKNGLLVNPFSVSSWVEAINDFFDKRPRRVKRFAREFAVSKVAKSLVSAFNSIV